MPLTPYYSHAGIEIYHGDCREILPHLSFDCVITDPPYGCSATTGWGGVYDSFSIQGDDSPALRDWLLTSIKCPSIVFGSPRIPRPPFKSVLIWSKGEHTGMGDLSFPWKPDFEEIYINGDGFTGDRTSSILNYYARTDSGRLHPTEKPLALMVNLVRKAPPGMILDPFAGSGTTLEACKKVARRAIGIEIEEKYCEIAARRLSQGVFDFSGVSS